MKFTKQALPTIAVLLFFVLSASYAAAGQDKPNIILIFADDLGYGDLGCYGSKLSTPVLDRLASEGLRSTDCLVAANVCGPSRASLMTGRYPMRCGHPISRHNTPKYTQYGIDPDELTIAELLKTAGYYNKMVGKWHLGFHVAGSHPLDAGFDEYLGLHSNYSKKKEHGDASTLYRNREVEKENVTFEEVTKLYNDEVVNFIKEKRQEPFFIYFSHHIPHRPILPSRPFKGASGKNGRAGAYGDFILELDHSVGCVLTAVEKSGIADNTLVVFLSDNGPAVDGSAKPLSGGKYVTMEGGHRIPAIFNWPGRISRGQISNTTITSMDLLPLFCHVAGVEIPGDRKIDGKNILHVLTGESKQSPHEFIYYYNGLNLQAIRRGKWKMHLPRTIADQPYWAKKAGGNHMKIHLSLDEPMLFNLDADVGEQKNVISQHPEVAGELMEEAGRIRREIGDVHFTGSDQRPHGLVNPNEKN